MFLCNDNSVQSKSSEKKEYVITPTANENLGWFIVENIADGESTGIAAVQQLNGRLYLPIFSSVPEFNNHVVAGYFVNDTNYYASLTGNIFVVTQHLRDTALGYYGE
jgi:hypothetical protein